MSEKIIIAVDASILDSWDLCKKYYELIHIKHYTTAYKPKSLDQGSLLHLMLKNYYTLKKNNVFKLRWSEDFRSYEIIDNNVFDFDVAVESSVMVAYIAKNDLGPTNIEEIINVFRGYCTKNRDENWKIIEVEKPFALSLYDSENLQVIGQGICDLIVETPTGAAIVDHKKRSRRTEESSFLHQKLMYTYALKINTFITNKLVFIKDPDRYTRQTDTYDEDQHHEWLEEVIMAAKEMIAYKSIGLYRRNPTSCDKYGGCLFRRLKFCEKTPSRRELAIGRDIFQGEAWDVGKQLEVNNE